MVKKRKTVKLSENNRRVGDDHPKAKFTDEQIEELRSLHDDEMFGYTALRLHCLNVWGITISKGGLAKILRYERRNTTIANFKTVPIKD